ncbi:NO-inducible flavohemoprotein [Alteromonas pelagimontana]|uniref:Flavohemoprotein n=1 Tax=Alteromonas pelagimontana TaxID=1858656 RepID=A0A6M4MJX0_9ALTE|nr:NO-inducible flavohemoprotein [Alteromonas pelagimontana]QJR82386.1 NO-inducible flavohemoprotein [Alteromonas pelagimontana]
MLSQHTIHTVKSTIPLLESAGTSVTDYFYNRMFRHNPELKDTFNISNQKTGKQPFALFSAIAAYAKNIDNLDALAPLVERVAHKHTIFFIQPEQYAIVGHHLIETLRELAPEAFTPDVEQAWSEAYQFLADILIGKEAALYEMSRQKQGGWYGLRSFKVAEKKVESDLVTSFRLKPVDGKPVITYTPGQYLGVSIKPVTEVHNQIRQYSLSDKPNGETYRISVKRETNPEKGIVSHYLHEAIKEGDTLDVYPPAGAFYLRDSHKPAVLISAGVGLTPMMSMLETMKADNPERSVYFLHACESARQHSFKTRIEELAATGISIAPMFWYIQPHEETGVYQGLMELSPVAHDLPLADGEFYLCGPTGFMAFIKHQLIAMGVNEANIFYEVFGPHDDL